MVRTKPAGGIREGGHEHMIRKEGGTTVHLSHL